MMIDLSVGQIDMIKEALAMAAARKETLARAAKRGAKAERRAEEEMRKTRLYLMKAATPRLMPSIL